jgi:hypothetical protein
MEVDVVTASPSQASDCDSLYPEPLLDGDVHPDYHYDTNNTTGSPCGLSAPKQLLTADGFFSESADVTSDLLSDMADAEEEQEEELPPLSDELIEGYKILMHIKQGLMPQKKPEPGQPHNTKTERYLHGVRLGDPIYEKYYEIVEQPMCLGTSKYFFFLH